MENSPGGPTGPQKVLGVLTVVIIMLMIADNHLEWLVVDLAIAAGIVFLFRLKSH